MRITPIKFYTPQFKAHFYRIEPKTCNFEIQTDNNPNLGEKPYLIYDDYGEKREIEMQKENGLYSAKADVYDLEDVETKFLDSHLSPEMLAAKQNYLKNPNPKTYKEFTTATFQHMHGRKLRILPHEMSNHVYPLNFSSENKYNKIKERLHLFDKFLEYNPEDKVSNSNPIDMTAIFKTFLDENNCKDIKMNGLELLENVIMGDYAFDVYYGLNDLLKFAQKQTDNQNITLSFDRDGALYATVNYKGKELEEKDFYKVIPSARSYDDLDPITTNSDGEYSSIRLRLKTLDGFMVI